jgi:hypothetical protein
MANYSYLTKKFTAANDWKAAIYVVEKNKNEVKFYDEIHLTVPKKVHFKSEFQTHVTFIRYCGRDGSIEVRNHWYLKESSGRYTPELGEYADKPLEMEEEIAQRVIDDAVSSNWIDKITSKSFVDEDKFCFKKKKVHWGKKNQ